MPNTYLCPITVSRPMGDYFLLTVQCAPLCGEARPGQFVHIKCGAQTLRRPISIADVNQDCLTLLYEVKGAGTAWLSQTKPGDTLDILGPLGTGYPFPDGRLLLVGGGIGVPPLYFAAKTAEKADAVLGFRSRDKAILLEEFEMACGRVQLMTDDGSLGQRGFVVQGVETMLAQDSYAAVLACGPRMMLRTTAQAARSAGVPCYVSLEERMGCGVGACLVCAVSLWKNGSPAMGHVCKDGPVFNAEEVVWDV